MAAAARELQCTSTSSPPASAQLTALAEQLVECARQIMDPYCPAEQRQQYQKVMIKCVCSLHVVLPILILFMHPCMPLFFHLFVLIICFLLSDLFSMPLFVHLFVLIFCFLLSDLFSMPLFVHQTSVCTYLLLSTV